MVEKIYDDLTECPFCAEFIKVQAKKCRHCHEWLPGHSRQLVLQSYIGGNNIGGDSIEVGSLSDVNGAAIGKDIQFAYTGDVKGSFIQAQRDVNLGQDNRDKQYEIVLAWNGKLLLREFDLAERDVSRLVLRGADLSKANLHRANISQTDLSGANLSQANLYGANLNNVIYDKWTIWPEGFDYCRSGAIGPGADLSGANLSKINLCGVSLAGANLKGTNVSKAIYDIETLWPKDFDYRRSGAIGPGGDLSNANLQGVDLSRMDLQEINLSGANLNGANLISANLQAANLKNASLLKAYLLNTNLQNTDLQNARLPTAYLINADLSGAKYNHATIWPGNFDPAEHAAKLILLENGATSCQPAQLLSES